MSVPLPFASRSDRTLVVVLGLVLAAILVALWLHGPIPQPAGQHDFADTRAWLGVPNFADVASNLAFLLVGALGLRELLARRPTGALAELRGAYATFFAATLLVALGSAYYHWAPTDASLVWDRMPMAIAFMAFVAVVVGERFDPAWGRRALVPLIALGLGSVLFWRATGDLRPYVAVQFGPMLLVPVVLLVRRSRLAPDRHLWAMLGAYLVAKVLEANDGAIFERLQGVSGHTLKHLVAALGLYAFVLAIRRRAPT